MHRLTDAGAFDEVVSLLVLTVAFALAVPGAALAVAAVSSSLGGRRFGVASFAMAFVVVVAAIVAFVTFQRTMTGEVTPWDLLWAAGLAGPGVWCLRRLGRPPTPPTPNARRRALGRR